MTAHMATKPRAERVRLFFQDHYTRGDGQRLAKALGCSPGLLSGVAKGRYLLGEQYWDAMATYYGTTVEAILHDSMGHERTPATLQNGVTRHDTQGGRMPSRKDAPSHANTVVSSAIHAFTVELDGHVKAASDALLAAAGTLKRL